MAQRQELEQLPSQQLDPAYRYSDSELAHMVDELVNESPTDWQTEIAQQRARGYKYYYGQYPYALASNTSDYTSYEVFDTIESLKAKMMRTFTSNRKVVRFLPMGEQDIEAADVRTEYVYRLFFDQNNGYKLLHDGFHDGLLAKLCAFKRVWREKFTSVPERFENIPIQQLEAAGMQEEVERIDIEEESTQNQVIPTPLGPAQQQVRVASGEISYKRDDSGVEVELIPPEDLFISSHCTDITDADFIAVRYEKTRYELVQEGFDPEIVHKLTFGDQSSQDYQDYARHSVDSYYHRDDDREGRAERSIVTVYEAFIYLDMFTKQDMPTQGAQLWHVVVAGNEVLHKARVDEMPFRFWSPVMLSHKAIGLSMADITADLQNASSNVVRGMIDNVHRVNAGVRMADLAKLRNPRDFIDNPIGGVIDADEVAQRSINVAAQPAISPATGALLQLFDQEKEKRTGDTQLGKGLQSQAVITHQNSGDMIDTLMNAGNERPMTMARSFSELCLKPLLLDIYKLGYENGQKAMLNVGGRFQEVDITQVPYGDKMTVDVALTPEYGENRAAQLMQLHGAANQDTDLQKLYSLEEKYAVFSEVYDLLGFENYLGDPKDPKVQKRMQDQEAQAKQMQDMQMQIQGLQLQLAQRGVQIQEKKVSGDQQLARDKLNLDAVTKADEQNLDEREFGEDRRMNRWSQKMDLAEYMLEKTQGRPASLN